MHKLWQQLLSILFPRACTVCSEPIRTAPGPTQWESVCEKCAPQIRSARDHVCEKCAAPVYGVVEGPRLCSVCRQTPPLWNQAICLVRYSGPVRHWVKDYKYRRALYLERDFARLLHHFRGELLPYTQGAILVPVPLHWAKQALRGFNQAYQLCRLVQHQARQRPPAILKLLRRVRWTPPQSRLHRDARAQNVRNAFGINSRIARNLPKDQRIVLVDDLFTSGATLQTCVRCLNQAGFKNVDILTLARA